MCKFDYDVFLSFASQNEGIARSLYERLTGSGLRVFWSDETLKKRVGQPWLKVIEESLESSKHFVVVWTEEANQSEFVRIEYDAFRIATVKDKSRLLIPLVKKGFGTETLPLFLRYLQAYDLDEDLGPLIKQLGGRFEPLEDENARLRDELAQAEERIASLNETESDAHNGAFDELSSRYKALEQKYTALEKQRAEETINLSATNDQKGDAANRFSIGTVIGGALLVIVLVNLLFWGIQNSGNKNILTDAIGAPGDSAAFISVIPEHIETEVVLDSIAFVYIPTGRFLMGSEDGEQDESPVHQVEISGFYMGKTEVTQAQWESIMGEESPSHYKGPDRPVENVSWNDVQRFIKRLNEQSSCTNCYRLPTEAEWEYAARAGTTTQFSFGDDRSTLNEYAWYDVKGEWGTKAVGQKKPNPWGLHDIYGNVWEWTLDGKRTYANKTFIDPIGPEADTRVIRGGGWGYYAGSLRSADRDHRPADIADKNVGFRLLRVIP